jgi:hypothetical protein
MFFRELFKKRIAAIIVLKAGFWFVDIPRTSSTSIRAELGKEFGKVHGKRRVDDQSFATEQVFIDHMPAIKMKKTLGNIIWNNIFKFSIVRNPWARTYSMYSYRKKKANIRNDMSFKDYVLALEKAYPFPGEMFTYDGFYYGASDYLCDENDKLLVDFVGKIEERDKALKFIRHRIGAKKLGALILEQSFSRRHSYSHYYDRVTQNIISKIYYKDIDLFNYEFDK